MLKRDNFTKELEESDHSLGIFLYMKFLSRKFHGEKNMGAIKYDYVISKPLLQQVCYKGKALYN